MPTNVESNIPVLVARLPQFIREIFNREEPHTDDKMFLEWRNASRRPAPGGLGGDVNDQMDNGFQDAVTAGHCRCGHGRRGVRQAEDGGIRLAGGRPGEVAADECDQDSLRTSESDRSGSTLPPPYASHYG